jgi:hypothetical protein
LLKESVSVPHALQLDAARYKSDGITDITFNLWQSLYHTTRLKHLQFAAVSRNLYFCSKLTTKFSIKLWAAILGECFVAPRISLATVGWCVCLNFLPTQFSGLLKNVAFGVCVISRGFSVTVLHRITVEGCDSGCPKIILHKELVVDAKLEFPSLNARLTSIVWTNFCGYVYEYLRTSVPVMAMQERKCGGEFNNL